MSLTLDSRHVLLLQACLLPDDSAARTAWRAWKRQVDLDDLDQASFRIMSLAYTRLRALGEDDPDLGRIRGIYRYQWTKNQIAFRGKAELLRAFAAASIPTLLLKGAALCRTAYSDATARAMHDLDLMVPTDRAPEVVGLLQARGWTAQHFAPEAIIEYLHACSFLHPDCGELDLHWHALRSRSRADLDAGFWAASVPHVFDGAPTRVLCPADQFLHACEHSLHESPSSALQWLADAVHILRHAGSAFDWDRLAEQSARFRLVLPVRHALTFLQSQLAVEVPAPVLARLRRGPAGWVDRLEYRLARSPEEAKRGALHRAATVASHYLHLRQGHPLVRSLQGFPAYVRFLSHYERGFGSLVLECGAAVAVRVWSQASSTLLGLRAELDGHPRPRVLDWEELQRHDPRGFYKLETLRGQDFRWSSAERGSLSLPLPARGCLLVWEFPQFIREDDLRSRSPVWRLAGRRLHRLRVRLPFPGAAFWIPARAAAGRAPTLTWTARPLLPGKDPRPLGLPLFRLHLAEPER